MIFEKPKLLCPSWDKNKFYSFCEWFCVKSIAPFYPSQETAAYVARFLASSPRQARKSKNDFLEIKLGNDELFDHCLAFKNYHNKYFFVSTPYLTEKMAFEEFDNLQKKYQVLDHVAIHYVIDNLKFMKNGDIMCLFEDWTLARHDDDDFYMSVMD